MDYVSGSVSGFPMPTGYTEQQGHGPRVKYHVLDAITVLNDSVWPRNLSVDRRYP
jgi:hypothetical protein